MKTDENGFVLCPKCNCPTEYLDFFNAEHQGKTYIVHWNIKCPIATNIQSSRKSIH